MSTIHRIGFATVGIAGVFCVLMSCATSPSVHRVGFPWPRLGKAGGPVLSAEVETVGTKAASERVLLRVVHKPTLANLDFAAYDHNPMLAVAPEVDVSRVVGKPPRGRPPFLGVLEPSSIVGSLSETPLREDEQSRPMAFSPLVDYLSRWNSQAASSLEDARTAVLSESWGRAQSMQLTFQQITTLYWHMAGPSEPEPGLQWWVEVEFHPFAELFVDMPDSDGDGAAEIYGRLRSGIVSAEVEARVREDYMSRELSGREVRKWLNDLASYWYPSYNTDVAFAGRDTVFPNEQTEPEIAALLGDVQVQGVLFGLRGKPDGKLIYNVFAVEKVPPVDFGQLPTVVEKAQGARAVSSKSKEIETLLEAEKQEKGGGSYEEWAKRLSAIHDKLRKMLNGKPEKIKGFAGKDGWLFFRGSLRYVVGGDLRAQKSGKNPFEAIVAFKNALASLGVDFLLVPVPTKVEVYPDKLVDVSPGPGGEMPMLNPYGRKFLYELAQAGVESVDLLPLFLAQRAAQGETDEALYLAQDTHWARKGLGLAARAVAARVEQYPWFASLGNKRTYRRREVSFDEPGDLVSRLPPAQARQYRPMRVLADQVIDEAGEVYDDDASSPIVVLGDSFTGVFERTFTTGAGVSAQLAAEIGHPVDLVMSYGGGPNVRRTLLRRGLEDLAKRRLVIWMFAARDLYDYYEDWEVITFD